MDDEAESAGAPCEAMFTVAPTATPDPTLVSATGASDAPKDAEGEGTGSAMAGPTATTASRMGISSGLASFVM